MCNRFRKQFVEDIINEIDDDKEYLYFLIHYLRETGFVVIGEFKCKKADLIRNLVEIIKNDLTLFEVDSIMTEFFKKNLEGFSKQFKDDWNHIKNCTEIGGYEYELSMVKLKPELDKKLPIILEAIEEDPGLLNYLSCIDTISGDKIFLIQDKTEVFQQLRNNCPEYIFKE